MRQVYRSISEVLDSPWAGIQPCIENKTTDRVLRSSKLEDGIYVDLRRGDDALAQTEQDAAGKLRSFPALSRDIYQSFYSLIPKQNKESALSVQARKFNAPILERITQSEDFPTLKSVCEGRELPAYEAASEFITQAARKLDQLLADIGGEKNALNTLETLENAETQARNELAELLRQCTAPDVQLEQQVIAAANKAESKQRQVAAVSKMVDANTARNQDAIAGVIAQAAHADAEKAEEVQSIIAAWGKAVALTLLEIAADGKRNFALIHFSGSNSCQVDVFRPGAYTVEDKMRAAETFLGGGTDFQTPMTKAIQLMKEDGFENADIIFITDGECELPENYLLELQQGQAALRFTVTGVLLDKGKPSMDFSLRSFCQNIYRTSELAGEDIVRELVSKRV